MKIRQKLIILLLAIAIVPAMVISLVAYVTIGDQITAKTKEQLESIANKQAEQIDTLLRNNQVALTGTINAFDLNDGLSAYFASSGKSGSGAINKALDRIEEASLTIDEIFVLDPSGLIMGSSVTGQAGKQLPAELYSAKAPDEALFTIRKDPRDGFFKLFVDSKFLVNNKQPAIMVIAFNLERILDTLEDYSGLGETGETVLAVKEGANAVSMFALRFDPVAAFKTKLNSLKLFDGNASYENITDYRKRSVMEVTRSIQLADWGLGTKIDRDEALAPIAGLGKSILIIAGLASFIIIVLAIYVARSFAKPITLLIEKTKKIIAGDFSQKITVTSRDEIGELGATFNTMTEQLAASYQGLERKVAERTGQLNQKVEELGQAKAKDDAMLGSIGEGMIVTDDVGNILRINSLAVDMLGMITADVVGKQASSAYTLYDDGDKPIPTNQWPIYLTLQTGQKTVQTTRVIHPGGTKSALGLTATPVIQQGKTIGAIEIIRDITKEKEVDRMKTEFISLASHQLRTPLSAIRWFTEMLISGDAGKLTTDQAEFAKNIADSTERMIQLVNSLLNISRIESGRIIIDPKPTDLRELVAGIVNDLKGKTVERNQTLAVSVHNELPKINIDPRLIGQVYLNLLTNAIKYTPKGGEITVFISRKGDDVVSQVTDNGYGIPVSEQAKMFKKFFRATNIVKVETDGTGLGMYLVKSIIESSGGKIWFKSEEGKGTTFWFSLPMSGMKAKAGEVTIGE